MYRNEYEVHVTQVVSGRETTIKLSIRGLRNALNQVTTMILWYLADHEPRDYHMVFEIKGIWTSSIIARIEV